MAQPAIGRVVGLCARRAGTHEYDVGKDAQQPEAPFVGRLLMLPDRPSALVPAPPTVVIMLARNQGPPGGA